ncbi:MAG: histidine phosphatase family protein [Deltaproteobacteria bacterium]|nr:histidine phosphatase family protein [Deltaproteobacteria bacterium]
MPGLCEEHGNDSMQDPGEASLPLVRAMPARLVMVRHGESEANLINRAIKNGIISEYPEGFSKIPDREIRLSKLGVEQARKTGEWLREQYPDGFEIIYVSDHTRAKETAALVCQAAGWHDAEIRIDPLLGERNWGRFASSDQERREEIMSYRRRDPLHIPMPDGETMLETRNRSRELLDRAAREFGRKNVLVFSHGEYIEAIWAEIAHLNTERTLEFFHSPEGDIKNCQVVEFAAVNPTDGEYTGKLNWVRSSCPQAGIIREWEAIRRLRHSPADLLEEVQRYPNLDFPSDFSD